MVDVICGYNKGIGDFVCDFCMRNSCILKVYMLDKNRLFLE